MDWLPPHVPVVVSLCIPPVRSSIYSIPSRCAAFLRMEMFVAITFSNSKHFGLVKNRAGDRVGKLQTVIATIYKTSFHSHGMDFLLIVASNTTYVCAGNFYSFLLTVFSVILHSTVTYHLLFIIFQLIALICYLFINNTLKHLYCLNF